MFGFLLSGITFGLAAGITPGPLLALLLAQTLRHGAREGIKVSLTPLLTDAPIVALSLMVLSRLSDAGVMIGWISIFGGLYVVWLGIDALRVQSFNASSGAAEANSFRKAMLVNFLNPHVYLFWMTVGSPIVLRAYDTGLIRVVAFVSSFYLCLCGAKILIAVLASRTRGLLTGKAYIWSVRVVGFILLGFGLWLAWDGAENLGRFSLRV